MRSSLGFLALAPALAGLACGGGATAPQDPVPTAVDPPRGYATAPAQAVIRGDGFLVRVSQEAGKPPVVETQHRAWLGDVELGAVTWLGEHELHATIPAGLPLGAHALTVENALGKQGRLEAAYTVVAAPLLSATAAVDRTAVTVGQTITLSLTVRNTGGTEVTGFALGAPTATSTDGASATLLGGPDPAPPAALNPGQSVTFTWTLSPALAASASSPGHLSLTAVATGRDGVTGVALSAAPAGPLSVTVRRPSAASLTAVLSAPASVNAGEGFTVTLTLTNGGDQAASVTSVARSPASCGAVTPTAPATLPGSVPAHGSAAYTWTCTGTAPSMALGATVVSSPAVTVSPRTVTVVSPGLTAVLFAPASARAGVAFTVTLTLTNGVNQAATVTSIVPTPSAACSPNVTPLPPAALPGTVPGRGSASYTWVCTAAAPSVTLGATVTSSPAVSVAPVTVPVGP